MSETTMVAEFCIVSIIVFSSLLTDFETKPSLKIIVRNHPFIIYRLFLASRKIQEYT